MSRPRGLWLLLLSVGLIGTLAGQEVVDEIPEGATNVQTTVIPVDPIDTKVGDPLCIITTSIDVHVSRPPTCAVLVKTTAVIEAEALSPKTRIRIPTLDVKNAYGAVRVEVRAVREPLIRARAHDRPPSSNDFTVTGDGESFRIEATPPDGARVDLELTVPYRRLVRMETTDGDLSYNGLGKAELKTDTGTVSLRFPEELTSFELWAAQEPEEFEGAPELLCSGDGWAACDRLPEWRDAFGRVTLHPYGRVTLRANRPRAVKLELKATLPEDSPIRPHWRAEELLPNLFRFARKGLHRRDAPREPKEEMFGATFSADARLVQLDVTASDRDGRPAADLTRVDFEVIENGKAQRLVEDISSAAAPFNLVLLLDCSSSTEEDRPAMEEAARRFIGTARPGDKVAVYALAETYFQILSPLTEDHEAAKESVEGIERFGGATPLYDAIVLAYAEELAARPQERNAMIVLSDGLENEIYSYVGQEEYLRKPSVTGRRLGSGAPSVVTFEDLQRAVREMRALIYPVVLDPLRSSLRADQQRMEDIQRWARMARQRSAALAENSGGTMFEAESAEDLDEVYDRVARELRSVYTLAYRPIDQDFDGKWRRVRVRTKRKGIAVRTRPGYYAH